MSSRELVRFLSKQDIKSGFRSGDRANVSK